MVGLASVVPFRACFVPRYQDSIILSSWQRSEEQRMVHSKQRGGHAPREIERVQTGVRMEKRILKVLKALAELHDLSLGDLLEGIVLHAFDGKAPFSKETLARIREL